MRKLRGSYSFSCYPHLSRTHHNVGLPVYQDLKKGDHRGKRP